MKDGETIPLYPVKVIHLPCLNTIHEFNNVEPRNIQMAQDLREGGKFCVALLASDSDRIASVGTIMRIVDMESQMQEGAIKRIVLKCSVENLVDIQVILNPYTTSKQDSSSKYLKAHVSPRNLESHCPPTEVGECEAIASKIINDYEYIRSQYSTGAQDDLLPYFVNRTQLLNELVPFTVQDILTVEKFWEMAQTWQTLCNTIQKKYEMTFYGDSNEFIIAAANAKGGPLQLPIKVDDLPLKDRLHLQKLESRALEDFIKLGLDPCLDFLVLLSLSSFKQRLEFFSKLITRECQRLLKLN